MGVVVVVLVGVVVVVLVGVVVVVLVSVVVVVLVAVVVLVLVAVVVLVLVAVVVLVLVAVTVVMVVAALERLDALGGDDERRAAREVLEDGSEDALLEVEAVHDHHIGVVDLADVSGGGGEAMHVGAGRDQRNHLGVLARDLLDEVREDSRGRDYLQRFALGWSTCCRGSRRRCGGVVIIIVAEASDEGGGHERDGQEQSGYERESPEFAQHGRPFTDTGSHVAE